MEDTSNSNFVPPLPPPKDEPHVGDPKNQRKNSGDQIAPEVRSHLRARETELNLEENLGKEVVINQQTAKEYQGGYFCETCNCSVKNSQAWMDHINGKKHNSMMGMSMKVERSSVDKVLAKLKSLSNKREKPAETFDEIEARLDEEEKRKKDKNKRRKKDNTRKLEEELEFNEDDITAFGLPADFGSAKRKKL